MNRGVNISRDANSPSSSPGDGKTATQTDPNAGPVNAGQDDSGAQKRIREVIEQRNRERQAWEREKAQILKERQDLVEVLKTQGTANSPANDPVAQRLEQVRREFGEGEMGEKAFKAVKDTVEAVLEANGGVRGIDTNALIGQISHIIDTKIGAVKQADLSSARIQGLVSKGILSRDAAQKVRSRMDEYMQDNAEWQNPQNIPFLIDKVTMELAEGGQITFGDPSRRGGPPVAPGMGGGGGNYAPSSIDEEVESIRNRFPSLQNKSKDEIVRLYKSRGFSAGEMAPNYDETPPEAFHGTYTASDFGG